jgi:thiamine-monophosphate kinase
MLGSVERNCLTLRNGGRPGDLLCVTGKLGGSLAGRHLDFKPRLDEARWLVKKTRPGAMMDLSDGLAKDLPRLADACGTGFSLDAAALPRHSGCSASQAVGDGEDYELLFTLSPRRFAALKRQWPFPRVPVTAIGLLLPDKRDRPAMAGGWDHFVP